MIPLIIFILLALSSPAEVHTFYNGTIYNMEIIPNGNYIAGVQTNFIYDARSLQINNIHEGGFLSQNGNFSTFTHIGTILTGNVTPSFSAIIGPHNTSDPGTFLYMDTSGDGCIKPTNIKISNPSGIPVPYNLNLTCDLQVGSISGMITTT